MLCVCSNRGFVKVRDSKPKVVKELPDKQHGILLSIAAGTALEKLMVSFFSTDIFSSGKCHLVKTMFSLLKKRDFSNALNFFSVWVGEQ